MTRKAIALFPTREGRWEARDRWEGIAGVVTLSRDAPGGVKFVPDRELPSLPLDEVEALAEAMREVRPQQAGLDACPQR